MTQTRLHGRRSASSLGAPASQIPLAVGRAYALVPIIGTRRPDGSDRRSDRGVRPDSSSAGGREWLAQRPGDFLVGNPVPATTVELTSWSFMSRRCAPRATTEWRSSSTTRHRAPGLPPTLYRCRRTFDVLSSTASRFSCGERCRVLECARRNYNAGLQLQIGPVQRKFLRGWPPSTEIHGRTVRFLTTPLETQDAPPVQVAQANS